MEKEILKTISYFIFFNYPPSLEEIHTFLRKKTAKKHLAGILENMAKKKVIKRSKNGNLYTLPQYHKRFKIYDLRFKNSQKKINKIQPYINLLSLFPQIKLVGFSGTVAMMNAQKKDDIDLFIITARNRLFTGRFIAISLAQLIGLRRNRHSGKRSASRIRFWTSQNDYKDKVCLNLFFDESNLQVPKFKQTEYVAHEVLQMKPLISKDGIYERFLEANKWVFKLFPNSKSIISNFKLNKNLKLKIKNLGDYIEKMLKKFQLRLINKHKTTEIITDSQLWFHPEDFGEKVDEAKFFS